MNRAFANGSRTSAKSGCLPATWGLTLPLGNRISSVSLCIVSEVWLKKGLGVGLYVSPAGLPVYPGKGFWRLLIRKASKER